MLDIVTMVFESTSMRYETLVARFWLRVRRVPQSSCRRQSRDKRQELWGRECFARAFSGQYACFVYDTDTEKCFGIAGSVLLLLGTGA